MATKNHKPANKQTKSFKSLQQRTSWFASRKGLLLFVVAFAAIGTYFLLRSSAAPLPPTVYLTTPPSFMAPNTSFSVQVRENSGATGVNAVQANISYPASLLQLVSIDTTGSAFGTEAQNTGGSGSISIARGTSCSTSCASLTNDQLVVTLNFKALTTGGAATAAFTTGTSLVSSSTNTNILPSLSSTAGFTVTIDTVAPTTSISAPSSGAVVSAPANTTITASATDNDHVTSVDIYVDSVLKTTLTTSPYNYVWNTTGVALGSHTIQSKAHDPSGNIGTSATITVTLADSTAPTTSITAPSAGSTLRGSVSINATASDNTGGTGLAKVEFYVDGVLKGTDTTSPYSYTWDTTTATNGSHSLTTKAYDAATPANIGTSAAVVLTVDNSAPTTPVNFQSTGNTLSSIGLSWSASTDNVGVSGYRLSRNGTTVATLSGSTLSYNDVGLVATTSYTYTLVALDAAGNASGAASLTASTQTAKTGDLNGDGAINVTDLSIFLTYWGTTNSTADINQDGIVNVIDLSILLTYWGT